MNNFIDNTENVIRIYESYCEHLETFPNVEKHIIIVRMINYYDNIDQDFDNIHLFIRHEQTRVMFRSFLTSYVISNPELIRHRNEIINLLFDKYLFQAGFELFSPTVYLK